MNVLLVQFENWQTALEDFQKNIEKELEEIRRHKAEVRQMKIDLIDHLGQGRYVRDENRIIISAPEIIIGDTDKSGMLQNGSSRVIIRANNINLEGVGSGATDTGSRLSPKPGASRSKAMTPKASFPPTPRLQVLEFTFHQTAWSASTPPNPARRKVSSWKIWRKD